MNKKKYSTPKMAKIKLDNEISLALASMPPAGPDESFNRNYDPAFAKSPFHKV